MRKEIPILFSTAMVQAIMDGRKTMTRRVVKPQPEGKPERPIAIYYGWPGIAPCGVNNEVIGSKWKPGDVLYVRETHYRYGKWVKDGFSTRSGKQKWKFVATTNEVLFDGQIAGAKKSRDIHNPERPQWYKRNSLFMPKEAARIWLEVVNVRVERLHEITEDDAKAEGVEMNRDGSWHDYLFPQKLSQDDAKASFISLWHKINGEESWAANPWVWVVEFKVLSTTGKPE